VEESSEESPPLEGTRKWESRVLGGLPVRGETTLSPRWGSLILALAHPRLTPWAAFLRRFAAKGPELYFTASSKVHFSRKRYPLLRRGIKSSVRGQGKSRTKSKAAGGGAGATGAVLGGPERSDVVGFTGTGYQRSLRVHESDEYNF
jgi:hypothetical protein